MSEDTERAIIKAIGEMRINTGRNKLSVSSVARSAGISRQAIYSLYSNFLPYITGELPFEDLVGNREFSEIQNSTTLQSEIFALKKTISELKKKLQIEIELVKQNTSTTLMQRDIEIFESATTKSELIKKTIQLNNKINDLKACRDTNTVLEAKLLELKQQISEVQSNSLGKMDKVVIKPELHEIKDVNVIAALKEIDKKAVNYLLGSISEKTTSIIIFFNRFNCSYNDFVTQDSRLTGQYIYISLTLPTARERKKLIRDLPKNIHVSAVIYEPNQANTNWYRRLHCQKIPTCELETLDKLWQPVLLSEGFQDISYFREPPTA